MDDRLAQHVGFQIEAPAGGSGVEVGQPERQQDLLRALVRNVGARALRSERDAHLLELRVGAHRAGDLLEGELRLRCERRAPGVELDGRIDLLLDGGATPIGLESTVLDLTGAQPALLRPGGVSLESLQQHIPDLVFVPRYVELEPESDAPASPGMLLKHYSPHAELMLFAGALDRALARMHQVALAAIERGERVGVMLPNEEIGTFAELPVVIIPLGPRDDMNKIGRRIFAGMRELDRRGVQRILVRGVERTGIGLAIWDRLVRAAEGRVIEADV